MEKENNKENIKENNKEKNKEETIKKDYGRVGKEILDIINKSKDDESLER